MTPVSDIIRRRFSCRSYENKPLDDNLLRTFRQAVEASARGLFGNTPRFVLLEMDELPRDAWKKLGTYGVIQNARLYIAGMIRPAPMATVDYGYCKEKLILKATELGLSTCWLGGTFAISAFGRAAGMRRDELMPTVSPVGYAAGRRSLTERLLRGFAGSDHRLPWPELFFRGNAATPLPVEAAGPYAEALENVRLGPSASNKQPWRIICDPKQGAFSFYLSRSAGYRHLRDVSLQEIDMGIALCHFDLTVRELGLAGIWRQEEPPAGIKSWEYVAGWRAEGK
ncbi:MAG: nitroreductase [Smithella sp.]|jgi:nitroreductase|nr:nitroreductase [Smithella sp.]HOU55401.1 nitroreductase family protein [Smithellaceae bacterium]HPY06934.1 nitroreductase family protein [Smithellaceae bacterium]HQJ76755.1 nitroreductase family protein [Smithellaceae bacterium]